MENLSSPSHIANCSCALVSLQYKVERAPSKNYQMPNCNIKKWHHKNGRSYNTTATTATHTNTNYNKKSKISLSRSVNQSFSNEDNQVMKFSVLDERIPIDPYNNCYETINIYNKEQNNEKMENSIISHGSDSYKFKKKQNSSHNYQKSKFVEDKWKLELQHTKNTTFDNSQSNFNLKQLQNIYFNKKMLSNYQFSFHNEKKSDEKTSNRKERQRQYQQPLNQQNIPTSFNNFSSKVILSHSRFPIQPIRRIKTLRQLDYRHAQSSGGGTSQNHMSMVISIDDQKQDELKGLDGLIRKSSMAFRLAKTEQLLNEVNL